LIYLGKREEKTSILRTLSRSLISTPWSLQSLTLTRFGGWRVKIAHGLGWEDGRRREEEGLGQTVKRVDVAF
jgi:hypothetical protein